VVQPGENLYRIALRYGVSVEDLARTNGIEDPRELRVGMRLQIPVGPSADLGGEPELGCPTASESERRAVQAAARADSDLAFEWPARGTLTTCFQGPGVGRDHEGLDIAAPPGTPVHAAEAGKVIYSGRLGAYGNVVVVKHAGRYSTVYAHNARNLVSEGSFVEKGQEIAVVGATGNATGPHLHFEIRKERRPDDPLLYLP
jgi:murein DD-endopeptidase MepM/ murein hydrolase activator NlpD